MTWKVLEETRLFFDPLLGPNDFINRGPRRFPTADLGGLIEDVRRNKFLYSVAMSRQCNNQWNVNTLATQHGKIQGGDMQANGFFSGTVQRPTSLYPYSTQSRKVIQNPQGKRWKAQNLEHRHPVLIKCTARFLQKYATPYFGKY